MKKEWLWVAALTALGFAVRVWLIAYHQEIEVDGAFYAALAKKISTGNAYFSLRLPPITSYAIAIAAPFCAGYEEAGRWVSVVAGTAALPLLYLLVRLFFSPAVGLIALALAVFEPTLWQYSSAVMSEPAYLFFFLLGLLVSVAVFRKQTALTAVAAGMTWGLAYLTRHEGLNYLVLLLLGIAAAVFFRKIKIWKGILLAVFVAAGFAILASPYLYFLKKSTGSWTFTDKVGVQLWIGKESVGPGWEERWEKALFGLTPDGTGIIAQQWPRNPQIRKELQPTPREMLQTYLYNGALFLKGGFSQWLAPFLLIFFGIGFYVLAGSAEGRRALGLVALLFLPFLFYPFFYFDLRYLFPLLPICLAIAACGVDALAQRFWNYPKAACLIALVMVTSFLPTTISASLKWQKEGTASKDVGEWIRKNYPDGARLMDRYPQIPFYGGAEQVTLPYAPLDEIIKYGKQEKAELLLLRKTVTARCRPWLMFLFEKPDAEPRLELVFKGRFGAPGKMEEVLVFKFR